MVSTWEQARTDGQRSLVILSGHHRCHHHHQYHYHLHHHHAVVKVMIIRVTMIMVLTSTISNAAVEISLIAPQCSLRPLRLATYYSCWIGAGGVPDAVDYLSPRQIH